MSGDPEANFSVTDTADAMWLRAMQQQHPQLVFVEAPEVEKAAHDVSQEKRDPATGEWEAGGEILSRNPLPVNEYKVTKHPVTEALIFTDPKTGTWPSEIESSKHSPLELGPHARRVRLSDKVETAIKKNGEKVKRAVPQYQYFHGITGKEIKTPELLDLYKRIAPPGVSNVRLHLEPTKTDGLLATWIDSKGLMQRKYAKAHDQVASADKFERLQAFNKALPKIRKQVKQDMEGSDSKLADLATVVYLIDKTGFRIGGDYSNTKEQAYGASTLLNKHVKVKGNKVIFDFTGKHGVDQHHMLRDQKLADAISKRKTAKWSEPLFNVTPGQVYAYVKSIAGVAYKPRDFRTWNGTNEALKEIAKRKGPAPSESVFKKWQNEAADAAAKKLGNTRAVVINNYIAPSAWGPWRQDAWGPFVPKKLKDDDD